MLSQAVRVGVKDIIHSSNKAVVDGYLKSSASERKVLAEALGEKSLAIGPPRYGFAGGVLFRISEYKKTQNRIKTMLAKREQKPKISFIDKLFLRFASFKETYKLKYYR